MEILAQEKRIHIVNYGVSPLEIEEPSSPVLEGAGLGVALSHTFLFQDWECIRKIGVAYHSIKPRWAIFSAIFVVCVRSCQKVLQDV